MVFARWDPVRDLLILHEQLGQFVGAEAPGWTPLVDLLETAAEFVLTVELPGLARDEFELQVEERRVVVRGARRPDGAAIPCEQYHRVERGHGRFSRAFSLPDVIDVERVTAALRDGVLTVTLPKAAARRQARAAVR